MFQCFCDRISCHFARHDWFCAYFQLLCAFLFWCSHRILSHLINFDKHPFNWIASQLKIWVFVLGPTAVLHVESFSASWTTFLVKYGSCVSSLQWSKFKLPSPITCSSSGSSSSPWRLPLTSYASSKEHRVTVGSMMIRTTSWLFLCSRWWNKLWIVVVICVHTLLSLWMTHRGYLVLCCFSILPRPKKKVNLQASRLPRSRHNW